MQSSLKSSNRFSRAAGFAAVALAATLSPMLSTARAEAPLVTDETIKLEREQTTQHKLRNGMPVIIRQVAGVDLLDVGVTFKEGLKDLQPGRKALNEWLWNVVPTSAAGYPKEKVFALIEKYGMEIGCSGGIEYSYCSLGTLNDYWKESLPLFAALMTKPAFDPEDVKLSKERLMAQLRNTPSDPGEYINEIINGIFYPVGHPYRLNSDEALKELETLGRDDLVKLHQETLNADNMFLTVVTSMDSKAILADLDQAFGAIGPGQSKHVMPTPPVFDQANDYSFNDRDLPTAYIRIKLNAPSIMDQDAAASRLLFEILSEELGDEIRTRRSLSYAVHSFLIQYHLGIGVISVSTSKPEQTLIAINDVLQTIKTHNYTQEDIEQFKHGFATSYYLTQETNASLASALSLAEYFFGDPNWFYDLPRRLDKVTNADIKRLANQWLGNLRVGVIFGRSEFKDEWAQDLIKKNLLPAAEPAKKP